MLGAQQPASSDGQSPRGHRRRSGAEGSLLKVSGRAPGRLACLAGQVRGDTKAGIVPRLRPHTHTCSRGTRRRPATSYQPISAVSTVVPAIMLSAVPLFPRCPQGMDNGQVPLRKNI